MLPGFALNNIVNGTFLNPVFATKFFKSVVSGFVESSDRANSAVIKFCQMLFGSFCFVLSAPFNHVVHVVLVKTKIEVIRVCAGSVVAFMKDTKAMIAVVFGYFSVMNHPRKSVGFNLSVLTPNGSVPKRLTSIGGPIPTGRVHVGHGRSVFVNIIPKTFYTSFVHVASLVSNVERGGRFKPSVPAYCSTGE